MKNPQIIGIGSIVSATILYSFFSVLTRTMGFTIPFFYQSTVRSLMGGAVLLAFCLVTAGFKKMSRHDLTWVVWRALGGFLGFVGAYLAFFYLQVGTAYFIFYGGSTIGGFLLGHLMFKEKITATKAVALGLGLLGLLLIYSLSFDPGKIVWMVWALAGGLGTAVWSVFSKKISQDYSASQLNALDNLVSAGLTLIISLIMAERWTMPDLSSTWIASHVLVLTFLLTGQLMVIGYKNLDAQKASLLMLLEIFFGIIVGNLYFHETLSLFTIVGGGLILVASSLPELDLIVKKQRRNGH